MPALIRERVISIICEEWQKGDIALNRAIVYELLKSTGAETSEDEVREVLYQLADHGEIILALEPGETAGPTVVGVRPGLCP